MIQGTFAAPPPPSPPPLLYTVDVFVIPLFWFYISYLVSAIFQMVDGKFRAKNMPATCNICVTLITCCILCFMLDVLFMLSETFVSYVMCCRCFLVEAYGLHAECYMLGATCYM